MVYINNIISLYIYIYINTEYEERSEIFEYKKVNNLKTTQTIVLFAC